MIRQIGSSDSISSVSFLISHLNGLMTEQLSRKGYLPERSLFAPLAKQWAHELSSCTLDLKNRAIELTSLGRSLLRRASPDDDL